MRAREVGELAAATSPQPRQLHADADEHAHVERDERDERDDEDEEDYGQRGHHGTDRSPRSCSALTMISGPRVSLVKTPVPAIGRPDCLDRVRGKATQGMLWRHRATRIGRTATGVLDAVNHSSIQYLWMPRSRRAPMRVARKRPALTSR